MSEFRSISLPSGSKIILGKDKDDNDKLMNKYKGKDNIILHTKAPGSPFCVFENVYPRPGDLELAAAYTARYSQYWRDNKSDVMVHVFTGKEASKEKGLAVGTWHIKKAKSIKVKKAEILKLIK